MASDTGPKVNRDAKIPVFSRAELVAAIASGGADYLAGAYFSLFCCVPASKPAADLIYDAAARLDFPSAAAFESWFRKLFPYARQILFRAAFTDFAPVPALEKETGLPLLAPDPAVPDRLAWRISPAPGINFLTLSCEYGCYALSLPPWLRRIAANFLEPPPTFHLSGCRTEERALSGELWNNSLDAAEGFGTLLRALFAKRPARDADLFSRMKKKKEERAALRAAAGIPAFQADAPDNIDLLTRFMLCMYRYPIHKFDGPAEIKRVVGAFFAEAPAQSAAQRSDRRFVEYALLMGHTGRVPPFFSGTATPPSRGLFQCVLQYIAQEALWFDAEKLIERLRITGGDFSFCDPFTERGFRVKGEILEIRGLSYTSEGEFRPTGMVRHDLLTRPLFQAYCFLFAALGLLEITEKEPALFRVHRGARLPLSPFERLEAVRITEFGRWCLDLRPSPPQATRAYPACADSELPVVVLEGRAPECRLYLDTIGEKLDENIWRVSAGSFIAGCASKKEIQDRIRRFTTLIDPDPGLHWRAVFRTALERAGLFKMPRSDMILYDLPYEADIVAELMDDEEFRAVIHRVEGGMVAVSSQNQPRFFALLNKHGISRV
ncbi:MAG: hypothetical protein LBD24_09080 [Spirochaetaceae bacterium]|jgi:hypothetical protein|nr:hypothetical protein [Spirochaetaceae bacterium]